MEILKHDYSLRLLPQDDGLHKAGIFAPKLGKGRGALFDIQLRNLGQNLEITITTTKINIKFKNS